MVCCVRVVSFLSDVIVLTSDKNTEDRSIRHGCSSPFQYRERWVRDPLVNPQNTSPVPSQTRLDGSRTDLCRRPCRVLLHSKPRLGPSNACPDTCREVKMKLWGRLYVKRKRTRSLRDRNAGRIFWNLCDIVYKSIICNVQIGRSRSPKLKIKCLLFSIFLGESFLDKICF